MKAFRVEEWQSLSGLWRVGATESPSLGVNYWWIPARMLDMELTDYILMLKNDFNAIQIRFSSNAVLTFGFKTQAEARKFKNWINAETRKRNFNIG